MTSIAAPDLALGTASSLPGQNVNIPVTFTNDGTVVSLQFDVQYNVTQASSGMPTAGAALGVIHSLASSEVTAGIRRIVVAPPPNNAVVGSGQIATIPFTIQPAAASGVVSLGVSNVVMSTASAGAVAASVNSGQITIVAVSTTAMDTNSGPNPALAGQTVTLTALVNGGTGSMAPTGIVTFKDGPTPLNTVALNNGSASMSISSLNAGTHSITAEYSGDTNNTASTSSALSVVIVASSTGYLSPAANAPETSSAGDGNGYEGAPANAYGDDALSATDASSGTGTGTSCTGSGKDKHRYYNYNFSIPDGVVIKGVTVRLDAQADSTSGTPRICVQLSWNGGTNWTTAKTSVNLTTSMATYTLGGATDTWGRTWGPGDFSNANFRVRLIDVASNTSRKFTLDWVAVRADLGLPIAPAINSTAVTAALVGNAYSYQATATGTSPITWSLVSGPSGMTIGSSTGLVSGWLPAAAGSCPVQIRATNSAGSNDQSYIITVADTGLRSPAANAAETASAGDNNGYEGTPVNAYGDDTLSATDTNSGTGTGTSCTGSGKDKHRFYNFGFTLPAQAAIRGMEVRLDVRASSTSGAPKICVQLSWDGGATWTAAKTSANLTTTMATYILGGASDTWGHAWSVSDFDNANFRVRLIDVASSTSRTFTLDWVAVRIYY